MKLNKREKILISVLGVILLIGGYYKFIFAPQREKINNLTQQKEEYDKKLQDINKKIALKSKMETDTKILNSKLYDMTLRLFPAIKQENFIVVIDKFLREANLRGISFTFSDIKAVPVEQVKTEEKNDKTSSLKNIVDEYNGLPVKKQDNKKTDNNSNNKDSKDNKDKPSAENISLTINFKGPYKNLSQFIKNIESYSKDIVVSNLQISQGGTEDVTGSMQLEFYAIPKISDDDKDFFKWEFNNAYGKENPFDGKVEASIASSIIEDIGKTIKEQSCDFVMSARPINSDLPTVMLGKSKDSSKSTYVYADNAGIENVEIYFAKKGDKYYYKYRTSKNTYPTEYSDDGKEFDLTNESINLKIFSNKRLDNSDLSGVSLGVYNKTDKEVNIFVADDDNVRPRVIISSEGGTVNVKRN